MRSVFVVVVEAAARAILGVILTGAALALLRAEVAVWAAPAVDVVAAAPHRSARASTRTAAAAAAARTAAAEARAAGRWATGARPHRAAAAATRPAWTTRPRWSSVFGLSDAHWPAFDLAAVHLPQRCLGGIVGVEVYEGETARSTRFAVEYDPGTRDLEALAFKGSQEDCVVDLIGQVAHEQTLAHLSRNLLGGQHSDAPAPGKPQFPGSRGRFAWSGRCGRRLPPRRSAGNRTCWWGRGGYSRSRALVKKAHMSATEAICLSVGLPAPWPVLTSTRSRIGAVPPCAACSAAANL